MPPAPDPRDYQPEPEEEQPRPEEWEDEGPAPPSPDDLWLATLGRW